MFAAMKTITTCCMLLCLTHCNGARLPYGQARLHSLHHSRSGGNAGPKSFNATDTSAAAVLDSWPLRLPMPKYHLYDPSHLLMYSACSRMKVAFAKHAVDKLFIETLIRDGKSVPPEEADVFVVPALPSQSSDFDVGPDMPQCGDHLLNSEDLQTFLKASPWFQRHNGRDHLLIADDWRLFLWAKYSLPGTMVLAHFECPGLNNDWTRDHPWQHKCLSVGYTTYRELSQPQLNTTWPGGAISDLADPFLPFWGRQVEINFLYTVDNRPAKRFRAKFICAWLSPGYRNSDRIFVRYRQTDATNDPLKCLSGTIDEDAQRTAIEQIDWRQSQHLMANSKFFLALPGDTPLSDRFMLMFDTLTIPLVLEETFSDIYKRLPHKSAISWKDIFVIIPSMEFDLDPIQSVLDTVDRTSYDEQLRIIGLLQKHAKDVLFGEGSVRHEHILREAYHISKGPIQ